MSKNVVNILVFFLPFFISASIFAHILAKSNTTNYWKRQQHRAKIRGSSSKEGLVLAGRDNVILDQLLRHYDLRIRPPILAGTNDSAVRVSVNILIRMLSKIDVVNMEYSLQITFREQWVDSRLAYNKMANSNQSHPKFLTVPHVRAKIWFPDTFFPTEKSAHRHMLDTENMLVRIYPDGTVLYSSRLSLVCSCPMHLQLYPLDVQFCDFDLISYAHTTRDIVYEWASIEPVQLKPGVGQDLPNFHLDPIIDTGIECASKTNTGIYACLRMRMRLSRLMTYFVLQLYIPTSLVVCVSLVSFWIDMHSTAGRVALAIMTLLTITTMQSSINAKLPPVNYVKLVDVWLGACQAFVFSALIEYAVVCYRDSALRNSQRRETEMRLAQRRKSIAAGGLTIDDGPFDAKLPPPPEQQWLDWATGERSALPEDEENLPCTCELGGIGSAVLASLGMVPFSGPVISSSLLLPIAATAESQVRKRRRNGGGAQKHTQFQVIELKKQRRPFWAWIRKKLRKPDYLPARIDYYARIWMPIGFLLFNCAYWIVCLIMASQQQMRAAI